MEEEEIEAVLAHEIGHYKEGHIPKKLILSFLTGLFGFTLFQFVLNNPRIRDLVSPKAMQVQ